MIRPLLLACLLVALGPSAQAQSPAQANSDNGAGAIGAGQVGPELTSVIARLSSLDYAARMNAARTIRRANAPDAVRALTTALRESADQFVRYRALVLLTGFGDRSLSTVMRSLMDDRNDRVREVAYTWMAAHPDREMVFPLLAALEREQAEFVRPALVRALATLGADPVVQRTLIAEVGRGLDFFRIAVIESLGTARASYARPVLATVAQTDGPLQDDAILALGRIGDPRDVPFLTTLMVSTPEARMARHAALCLLADPGDPCAEHVTAIQAAMQDVLPARRSTPDALRPALGAASAIGEVRPAVGYPLLLTATERSSTHDLAALVLGASALRRPDSVLAWMQGLSAADREAASAALQFAFARLEDDVAQEAFFSVIRARYWQSPEGSADRALMDSLIQRLSY